MKIETPCATGSLPLAARANSQRTTDNPAASGNPHGQRQTAAAARGTHVLAALMACALAVYLGGCGDSSAGAKPKGADGKPVEAAKDAKPKRLYPVRAARVATRPVQYDLSAIGSVEAQDTYRIDARVAGTIYDVDFNEGDGITPDKVLCRIAPEAYRQQMLKAKALYDQAVHSLADTKRKNENEIKRQEVKLAEAKLEIARREEVQKAGAISTEEIQLYQSKRDLAKVELKDATEASQTEIKTLEALIAQRDAELKIAEDDVRKSTVVSPIPGKIEKRMVTNLMFVTPGTPLATLVDNRTLKLIFKVSEKDSAAIKEGQKVLFTVPAWNSREFEAQIYFVENRLDVDARVVICNARVTKDIDKLKPGYYAAVKIVTENKTNALVVPTTAILPTEKGFVAYVIDDGKAKKRFVKVGLTVTNNELEILSGLSEGEMLVVEGANALQDNAPVRILDSNPGPQEKTVSEREPKAETKRTE